MNDTTDQRSHLWKLIKDIKFAMFTTRHGNGHLHARPMTTQNKNGIEADESLWFFMSKKGDPVDDLKADPVVNLVYADTSADTYVSVSGTAAMLEDQAKKDQLWSKMAEAWFPGRLDRPRPRPGAGADRARQLLGREGKQARPAVHHGQGRGDRQAADRARRARRRAHALSRARRAVIRHKVTQAARLSPAAQNCGRCTALFRASGRGPCR